MRKLFAKTVLEEMYKNKDIIVITADMGYGLWDDVRDLFFDRFYNVGSSEQFIIGCAAGMAMEGKIPICYSITSFLLYRPFEFIRNFMNHEKLPIKLAGGGRDKDYGYLGFTHWMEDDINIMSQLKFIQLYKPEKNITDDKLQLIFTEFIYNNKPSYINLIK
jgi:transketolase